jgi:hypothetical protein
MTNSFVDLAIFLCSFQASLENPFSTFTAVVNCGAVLYFQRSKYSRDSERQTKTTTRLS